MQPYSDNLDVLNVPLCEPWNHAVEAERASMDVFSNRLKPF